MEKSEDSEDWSRVRNGESGQMASDDDERGEQGHRNRRERMVQGGSRSLKKNTKEARMSFTVIMELAPFFLSKLSIFPPH